MKTLCVILILAAIPVTGYAQYGNPPPRAETESSNSGLIAATVLFLAPVTWYVGMFGGGAAWLARVKGFNTGTAFVIGLIGGPFGLLIYAGAPFRIKT